MCGIFGIIVKPGAHFTYKSLAKTLKSLYQLSESRGKESAGLHAYFPEENLAWTLKGATPASEFIRSNQYATFQQELKHHVFPNDALHPQMPVALLAHSRLVTNGCAENQRNNQPVRYGNVSTVHNGIVVNVDKLWMQNPILEKSAEVDTEVISALLNKYVSDGHNPISATKEIYNLIEGAASIAWVHDQERFVVLATNTGDLYYYADPESNLIIFASERYFLEQTLVKQKKSLIELSGQIEWVQAGTGKYIDLDGSEIRSFDFDCENIEIMNSQQGTAICSHNDLTVAQSSTMLNISSFDESLVRYNESSILSLKRCSRCILPETFPFIKFDSEGVCNYCRSYKPRYLGFDPEKKKKEFIASVQRYKGNGKNPDVIVPFSGGRDSCYGLHLIKKEFGLTPTTFTYDWGMVTDLARRNTARLCGSLGVENILVSADIKKKRENIRKNVTAWLHRPELGLVPLFMAGDKHFFSVVNHIKRQTGIRLDLWSANPLENTDFKSGFCGVSPDFDKSRVDYLSFGRKAKMASYYGINFLKNPRYINSSILDTLGAFFAYYFEPRNDFFFMFDHMVWNEDDVNRVLINEYDFELSPDSTSSWRIGDGTAPFYNYIYVTSRGFCEFDTFRSNQIREGMITREQAVAEVVVENRPRVESLRWYLDSIGLDFDAVIKRVNQMDVFGLHV
ncbi:MAG: hypothetical protein R3E73_07510 [Porticoccaceae bacterium]|nr:hypothetical protein [Pseudomonadales bacterium]